TTFLPHQQPAGSRPQRLRRCECHTLHQGRKINDVATNTRIDFRRHLSGLAGEAEESSVSRSGRTYLEHWAGIRGGRGGSRSDSSGSDPPRGATPRERGQEQHRQQQQPITTFFGRTYLVPTIRMPPFPPQPSAARHGGSAGTKADRAGRKAAGAEEGGLEDEDERVFEWMSGMLLQGNG
ncbi:unnamed protein product, partial [Sphacelaria rigidula]